MLTRLIESCVGILTVACTIHLFVFVVSSTAKLAIERRESIKSVKMSAELQKELQAIIIKKANEQALENIMSMLSGGKK